MSRQTGNDLYTCALTVTAIPPVEVGTDVQTSFEGQVFLAVVTVTRKTGATDTGKLALVGIDDAMGGLSWSGAQPVVDAKADIVRIQTTPNVPSWLAQAQGADPPVIVPVGIGGYWDLVTAATYNANPLSITFGQGPTLGYPWVIRYMIRIRQGATGTMRIRAWCDASTDSLLLGGRVAESVTSTVTISKGGVVPSLDAPTSITATTDSAFPCSVSLSWVWPSLGDHRELSVVVEAANLEGPPYSSPTVGQFFTVAELPPGATSWQENRLTSSALRFYRVRRDSATTTGTPSAIASTVPSALPSATATAVIPTVSAGSYHSVLVDFGTAVQSNVAAWIIERQTAASSTWVTVASVSPYPFSWVDRSVAAGVQYRYRIRAVNYAGATVDTGTTTGNVGVPSLPVGVARCAFSMASGYQYSTLPCNGAVFFLSDGDRGWIFANSRFYPRGELPFIAAGVLTDASVSGSLTGTFVAYAALIRYPSTRSVPCPVSNSIGPVTNTKLTLTMPNSGGKVLFRDVGSDLLGGTVDGADAWEFYLAETSGVSGIAGQAYLVGTYPLTTTAVTTPAGLVTADLANATRRPMETGGQSAIGPACARGAEKDGHTYFGVEDTFRPIQGSGASLAFTNGSFTVTSTAYTLTTALLSKVLVLGGVPSPWQVTDVTSTTTLTITATDPALQAVGWQGGNVSRSDFEFQPNPPSVYVSPIWAGEAGGRTSYSRETMNPATILQAEIEATNMQPLTSLSIARDTLVIGKREQIFGLRGGGVPDSADLSLDSNGNEVTGGGGDGFAQSASVFGIIQKRGIIAPDSLVDGPDGSQIYLDIDGPCLISASGAQPLGPQIGTSRLFQETFDTGRLSRAQGCFLPDQQIYIVGGIDARDHMGGRDGFVYSLLAGWMSRLRWASRVTKFKACERDDGKWQALFGDERGMVGVAFAEGTSEDDIDLSGRSNPWVAVLPVNCEAVGGAALGPATKTGRGEIEVVTFCPTFRSFPGDAASNCRFDVEIAPRNGKGLGAIESFVSTAGEAFTTFNGSGRFHPSSEARGQAVRVKMLITPARNERVEFDGFDIVVARMEGSQTQDQPA